MTRAALIGSSLAIFAMIAATTVACQGTGTQSGDKQGGAPKPSDTKRYVPGPKTVDGIGLYYMGREIAHYMTHEGAPWLDRPERYVEEAPQLLLDALNLKPGMEVADVGAGSGYFTFAMAAKVGSKGKVYATDIQPEMLDIIRRKATQNGTKNVELVLGTTSDAKLPEDRLDLIVLVDVYHEFDQPYEMTESMVKALKKGGKLVLVEYRAEDPRVPIKPLHKMTAAQVKKEMAHFPLEPKETRQTLPRQHILVFEKK